ncbi:MAG: peptidylprolyl isomerase [Proteobacteria bacterium]|nr:peptidylprolyl isomerase [Pseudomonadota bacterium]
MKIDKNSVARIHYSVAETGGSAIEDSRIGEPISVLVGHRNVIPGLENALIGREVGERFEVTVPPEEGYGPRHANAIQRLPKKVFQKNAVLKPGEVVLIQTREGQRAVVVHKVGMTVVDVDINHPMAGKTLTFDIEVMDVREGSAEEIAHGHAHGDGGHQH